MQFQEQHLRIVTRKRDRLRDEENRHERDLAKKIEKFYQRANAQQSSSPKQRRH